MKIAVYPGSFDPFTTGHLEIVKRAAKLFDRIYVAVMTNPNKHAAFTEGERVNMITAVLEQEKLTACEAAAFSGFTVTFAREVHAGFILRGLRNSTDLEYEMQIDAANKYLAPDVETLYLVSDGSRAFISSSTVREIASFGGAIDGLVPDAIKNMIAERLMKR